MSATRQVETLTRATDLPPRWDVAAGGNLFLQRESLRILEATNPCNQRYHFAGENDACSIAVTYRHNLDLLTYGRGSFKLPITIVGIPCSVSSSGCRMAPQTRATMSRHLRNIKGLKLVLNTDPLILPDFRQGTTLPTCRLINRWPDFPAYLSDMRSHYRNRVRQAQTRWSGITETRIDRESFSPALYTLYENVFNRSSYKLEKLGIDFFRAFPADIMQFSVGQEPIAFVQTVFNDDELLFMFAGMDYRTRPQFDTYLNLLLYIIRKGIDAGCRSIDLGQTAEEIKCKTGAMQVSKQLHVAHSSKLGDAMLRPLTGLLSYPQRKHEYRVFKQP